MKIIIDPRRVLFTRDAMIYGHFLEHFHRQIYGGVYDPGNPLSDEDGFRKDVLEALRHIQVPVIRWPGGCYVSAYHWKNGVGLKRVPSFDKAWRVEESNAFGTDEFVKLCRKIGCEPYICTNAGSGSEEEMSDWVEYCNLPSEGQYARARVENGSAQPHRVKYWSVGNENYLDGEIGSKTPEQWGYFVKESAKMMKRVDPGIQLSAAAIADVDWNVRLLKTAGRWLNWISVHGYWDGLWQDNTPANYEQSMAQTADLDRDVRKVRGLLNAFGLEKQIRIAYDEWNLRGWHHPRVDTAPLEDRSFLEERDKNDDNSTYTMADAVFSACFLNMLLRNADIVGMANYAPTVNTRGLLFTHEKGIVRRTTYYVFELYTRLMGEEILDSYSSQAPLLTAHDRFGKACTVEQIDIVATRRKTDGSLAVSLVNKHPAENSHVTISGLPAGRDKELWVLTGPSPDAYNDIGSEQVKPMRIDARVTETEEDLSVSLPPCSVCVLLIKQGVMNAGQASLCYAHGSINMK